MRPRAHGRYARTRTSRPRLPEYRIARSVVQLITQAWDEALRSLKDNPKLTGQSAEALRCPLYLYERDDAWPLLAPDEPFAFALRKVDAMFAV